MNSETIINQILKEKEIFLKQFNEKKRFDKETGDYWKFLNSEDSSAAFLLFFLSSIIISIISGCAVAKFFPEIKNIIDGLLIFPLAIFLGILTTFTINKTISRFIFNKLYKNRNQNDIINKLFTDYFYKTNISDEVHNMLKIYLSDSDYLSFVKRGLTYKNAYNTLNEIIESEKILSAKRNVFLTPEEIKKYQLTEITLNN